MESYFLLGLVSFNIVIVLSVLMGISVSLLFSLLYSSPFYKYAIINYIFSPGGHLGCFHLFIMKMLL